MVHRLAAEDEMVVAEPLEQPAGKSLSRTLVSCRQRMSGASSVRNFSTIADAGADRIDVPGGDLERGTAGCA